MKKYVTIPFNIYQELTKNTKKKKIESSRDKLNKEDHDQEMSQSNQQDHRLNIQEQNRDHDIQDQDQDQDQDQYQNQNQEMNNEKERSKSPERIYNEVDSSSNLSLPAASAKLPPPGIPQRKNTVTIIKQNNNRTKTLRVTRNQGRWHTPWKTRFS